MIINLCHRNNDLLKEGRLDEQIIADLEAHIENKKRYQREHLDKLVKVKAPHHYEGWTEKTQLEIKYAERILECVKANIEEAEWIESPCGFDIHCTDNYICSNCGHTEKLCTRYCSFCGKSMKDKKANWRCN